MSKMSLNQIPRSAWAFVLAGALVLGVLFVAMRLNQEPAAITNFEQCQSAGYPIMESYPRQCSDGTQTFVEDISDESTTEFTSEKGVTIIVVSPVAGATVSSPLEISGQVPGSWSFEATFPIVLTDWNGLIIAEGYGTLQGDWMTTDMVSFDATLEFEKPAYGDRGTLILQKANASGLSEHDDAVEIDIRF